MSDFDKFTIFLWVIYTLFCLILTLNLSEDRRLTKEAGKIFCFDEEKSVLMRNFFAFNCLILIFFIGKAIFYSNYTFFKFYIFILSFHAIYLYLEFKEYIK